MRLTEQREYLHLGNLCGRRTWVKIWSAVRVHCRLLGCHRVDLVRRVQQPCVPLFLACRTHTSAEATANFILTELNVFDLYFPDGVDNSSVKFRAVVWAMSEGFLFFAILTNLFSPAGYSWIFRASFAIIFIDLFATVIYLPIGVSQTYGFQSASFVFTSTYNGIGASDSIAWVLSFLSTSGILTGFDAAGHVAEETKDASLVAARGIFWSAVATSLIAFVRPLRFLRHELMRCSRY